MAQPARHRERSRKTLPAGDPKFGLTAEAGKLYLPAIQSSASLQFRLHSRMKWPFAALEIDGIESWGMIMTAGESYRQK
jgi:hypothetical protein